MNIVMMIAFIIVFVICLITQKPIPNKNANYTKALQFPMASVVLILYIIDYFLYLVYIPKEYFSVYFLNNPLQIIRYACLIFLAVMLLMKKRNKILILPIAVLTLLSVYYSVIFFSVSNLLSLIAFALTLVFVFSINKTEEEHNKLSEICKK